MLGVLCDDEEFDEVDVDDVDDEDEDEDVRPPLVK